MNALQRLYHIPRVLRTPIVKIDVEDRFLYVLQRQDGPTTHGNKIFVPWIILVYAQCLECFSG